MNKNIIIQDYYDKLKQIASNIFTWHDGTIEDMIEYYKYYHKKKLVYYPVDPSIYNISVQDFLEICDDASTHGIEIHYIGGKLYYSYII